MKQTNHHSHSFQKFSKTVAKVRDFALQEMKKEAEQKQLYYHNCQHVQGVERRANQIFQVIKPYWQNNLEYINRMELLLEICTLSHDLVQEFVPQSEPHTARKREMGVSEAATIHKLMNYIHNLNEDLSKSDPNSLGIFTNSDLGIIKEAIEATICLYDPTRGSIYQAELYNSEKNLSIVSRITALADIGTLGIEGIEAFNAEGSLLFLEENIDLIPIILQNDLNFVNQELHDHIRQRLLKRARFQVNFAKDRLARYTYEIEGLPVESIPVVIQEVFKFLNPETIEKIEANTPTSEDATLEQLMKFFDLKRYLGTLK
ncbi:MAG: hypothetical protein C6Y22_21040 [Hapalosiphonaceae cyanobacterium JJU2]|nr:MAG: hypothetical protein C6Y22_21040 [Hapalosiphonaceae cyanobacterium JJU2]